MVLVGGVEELGDRGVGITLPVGVVKREGVVKGQRLADRTGKVEKTAVYVLPVGMGNTVVATSCLERRSAIAVVSEFTSLGRKVVFR